MTFWQQSNNDWDFIWAPGRQQHDDAAPEEAEPEEAEASTVEPGAEEQEGEEGTVKHPVRDTGA